MGGELPGLGSPRTHADFHPPWLAFPASPPMLLPGKHLELLPCAAASNTGAPSTARGEILHMHANAHMTHTWA